MKLVLILLATLLHSMTGTAATKIKVSLVEYPPRSVSGPPPQGTTIDLLNKIFEKTDYQLEYDFIPWARTFEAISNDTTDLILWVPAYASPELATKVDAGQPIFYTLSFLFYNKKLHPKGLSYKDLSDLKGNTVGSLVNAHSIQMFKKAGLDTLTRLEGDKLLELLIKERIDFVDLEDVIGILLLKSIKDSSSSLIAMHHKHTVKTPIHLAVRKSLPASKAIRTHIDKRMKEMLADGSYLAIVKKNYKGFRFPKSAIPSY